MKKTHNPKNQRPIIFEKVLMTPEEVLDTRRKLTLIMRKRWCATDIFLFITILLLCMLALIMYLIK